MPDFTIIIPHRGNALGLWATIQSCSEELSHTPDITYNFVIVSNGESLPVDAQQCLGFLKSSGKLLEHIHEPEPLTPPAARQRGAAVADGTYLAFFDNHCLVGRQYFERALHDFKEYEMDMLHSTTCFYPGDGYCYHYRLKLEYNFWADSVKIPYHPFKPYKLAVGGHGGFFVRKDVWDEVGGYGPDNVFVGYGGEELAFDLKMWMFGKSNWIDPRIIHHHYAGVRGYSRHFTDEYYTNLMASANVIGGKKWLEKTCENLITKSHIRLHPEKSFLELMEIAGQRSAQYADEVARRSVRSFDELLLWFRDNEVQY